jgi:hypothetical protein
MMGMNGKLRRRNREVRRRTDHGLLLADNLTQVLEDLVELGDALLDLFDLAFTFLDQLFLEFYLRVRDRVHQLLLPARRQVDKCKAISISLKQIDEGEGVGTYGCSDSSSNCSPSVESPRLEQRPRISSWVPYMTSRFTTPIMSPAHSTLSLVVQKDSPGTNAQTSRACSSSNVNARLRPFDEDALPLSASLGRRLERDERLLEIV